MVDVVAAQELRFEVLVGASRSFLGMHQWKDAPPHRDYLAHPHVHMFHISVYVRVGHSDRAVEMHDLGRDLEIVMLSLYPSIGGRGSRIDFGGESCEEIATRIATRFVALNYDVKHVTVAEDQFHQAIVTLER